MRKVYLGDGVYAEITEDGTLLLTTENGISVTNRIYLEGQVIVALFEFLKAAREPAAPDTKPIEQPPAIPWDPDDIPWLPERRNRAGYVYGLRSHRR